ncbi:hypothetical protein C9374_004076 [Naegleria lovaniensis]|uniref:Right handed beta helix domain-containing protein n=1 Tax=Naegleria lovaniensis TaxID=51637 RepID=A0AA88KL94_NAELO|nr:uncharacterized protein C9374_004076 [Naegleria lovaniensis]KAG2383405.1 hypothetical protein C9374_004076 [Naegleria lovaniensis]
MILSVTDQIFTAQAQAQEFHSMHLEMCRGFAISGYGSYYVVKNMIISNTGNAGVQISQCHFGCQIVNSTFYELGQGGLNIGGGVRAYLNATNTLIMNNTMFNFTRIGKCYRPGVNILGGVGYTITHNEIYSADHSAIVYKGNYHDISYNKIYDVCKIVGDAGAIYSGRDWTFRGNTIRYNLIAKSRGPGLYGTTCLYLDDRYSSAEVYGNIFYDCYRGIQVGGGRDNHVFNNIFVNNTISLQVDWRVNTTDMYLKMYSNLMAVPYQNSFWSKAFPNW